MSRIGKERLGWRFVELLSENDKLSKNGNPEYRVTCTNCGALKEVRYRSMKACPCRYGLTERVNILVQTDDGKVHLAEGQTALAAFKSLPQLVRMCATKAFTVKDSVKVEFSFEIEAELPPLAASISARLASLRPYLPVVPAALLLKKHKRHIAARLDDAEPAEKPPLVVLPHTPLPEVDLSIIDDDDDSPQPPTPFAGKQDYIPEDFQ